LRPRQRSLSPRSWNRMAKGLVAAGLVGLALLCAAADARIVSSVVRFLHPARLLCAPRGLCARYLRSSRPRGGRARAGGMLEEEGGARSGQRAAGSAHMGKWLLLPVRRAGQAAPRPGRGRLARQRGGAPRAARICGCAPAPPCAPPTE